MLHERAPRRARPPRGHVLLAHVEALELLLREIDAPETPVLGDVAHDVDLLEREAETLGARSRGIVRRVIIPSAAPQVMETLRLVLGWAWTYVIVAELIGSSSGIGHMIIDSQALLATGQIIFGIIVIGVIGLVSDFLFKAANRKLFPWSLA